MNFFKLYIGDYQRDTGTLSLCEHGAYLMMLQFYYATEAPLPSGKELYRLLRAQDKRERDAIDVVVASFWRTTDKGLVNSRGWIEIEKGQEKIERNREIGRLGGRPRKDGNPNKTQTVIKHKPRRNPNQTPDTIANIDSVTNVTGADAPPEESVWNKGVVLFSNAHVPEKEARTMIGKWCKKYGQSRVLQALDAAEKNEAANPLPYIEKVLQNIAAKTSKKETKKLSEKDYSKGKTDDGNVTF